MTEQRSEAEWREWAETHRACWEVMPLIEFHNGQNLHVGFEFNIFAQIPPSASNTEARREAFPGIAARLNELVAAAFPIEGEIARFEALRIQTAVRMRPETGFAPEIQITCRVFHKDDYFQKVAEGERQRLAPLEERLKTFGLQAKSWARGQ